MRSRRWHERHRDDANCTNGWRVAGGGCVRAGGGWRVAGRRDERCHSEPTGEESLASR